MRHIGEDSRFNRTRSSGENKKTHPDSKYTTPDNVDHVDGSDGTGLG